MAVMDSANRQAVADEHMRDLSAAREIIAGCTKADIRAAVDAADTWANDNAAAFNSALPLPARTSLTAAQKARLLNYVVRRRWITGA